MRISGFNWPYTPGTKLTPAQLQEVYSSGFPAVCPNPIEREKCYASGVIVTSATAERLVKDNPGAGRAAYLWRYREQFDPGAFGQEAQTTGDCVSHGDRNARDVTRSVEILVKGDLEEYQVRGATEPTYGMRGHSGAGMDPYLAAQFVVETGWLGRKNYSGVVDLSLYDSRIGTAWGRTGTPVAVRLLCEDYNVGKYVTVKNADEAMAAFYNGYAGHSGQNIGFASTPDKNGIHQRSGSWNHDMATVGYDDTRIIWPRRVYFVVNSWGEHNTQWSRWLSDPEVQKILGPPITGMIVVDADVWESYFMEGMYYYTDINGFKVKQLPDYGTSSFLP
jgi:hypothetical protein